MEQLSNQSNNHQSAYAGFWLRLAAHIIDHFVISFTLGSIIVFVGLTMGVTAAVFDDMVTTYGPVPPVTFTTNIPSHKVSQLASVTTDALISIGFKPGTVAWIVSIQPLLSVIVAV
jgi:hypothetical protein